MTCDSLFVIITYFFNFKTYFYLKFINFLYNAL